MQVLTKTPKLSETLVAAATAACRVAEAATAVAGHLTRPRLPAGHGLRRAWTVAAGDYIIWFSMRLDNDRFAGFEHESGTVLDTWSCATREGRVHWLAIRLKSGEVVHRKSLRVLGFDDSPANCFKIA
jgi:hypothetical protein